MRKYMIWKQYECLSPQKTHREFTFHILCCVLIEKMKKAPARRVINNHHVQFRTTYPSELEQCSGRRKRHDISSIRYMEYKGWGFCFHLFKCWVLQSVQVRGLLRFKYLSLQSGNTSDIQQSNIPTLPPRSAYQLNDRIHQLSSKW